uniref:Uncharacterized protein n=1 Tax=Lactuca sativa TaxID=4236 RepID=A0A9R1X483_LACSA|nr:hypothetical protein LSAT_V11C600303420 [Lactuca sativa]
MTFVYDIGLHCVITIIRYTSMYRVACAWIVGKASQNNPVVQKQVLELGALPKLMTMVKSSVLEEEAIKALYVVSTIIRNNLNGLKLFYFEGGDLMLKGILSNATADVRLRRRSVSLVADMAEYQLEYTSKWDVPFFCNCALVRLLIDLTASGSFSLLKSSLQILNWVFINFLRPAKNLKKDGSWALVTGPTDGIGKAFAFQLASKGLNLVLVGRNLAKLNDVSDSIRTKFKQTQIKVVVVDFSCDLDHGIGRIKETVAGIDVRVLINNVGVCYPYARFFHEVDDKLMFNFIKVNVEGTTKVTNVVLTGMIKRKKGAIESTITVKLLVFRFVTGCEHLFLPFLPFTCRQHVAAEGATLVKQAEDAASNKKAEKRLQDPATWPIMIFRTSRQGLDEFKLAMFYLIWT